MQPALMIATVSYTHLDVYKRQDHCRVIFDFYFSDVSETARAYNEQSVAVGSRVQDEDLEICEAVQRGLKSVSYTHLDVYKRQE